MRDEVPLRVVTVSPFNAKHVCVCFSTGRFDCSSSCTRDERTRVFTSLQTDRVLINAILSLITVTLLPLFLGLQSSQCCLGAYLTFDILHRVHIGIETGAPTPLWFSSTFTGKINLPYFDLCARSEGKFCFLCDSA